MGQPYRLFYIYTCDAAGHPITYLGEGHYRSGAEAVNRFIHSYGRKKGQTEGYYRLRELQRHGFVVGLTEDPRQPATTVPVRAVVTVPASEAQPAARPPQLSLF